MEKSRWLRICLVIFAVFGGSQGSQAAVSAINDANANAIVAGMWSEIDDSSGFRLSDQHTNTSVGQFIGANANNERLLFLSRDNDSIDWVFSRKPQVGYKTFNQGEQRADVELAITAFPQLNMLGNSYLANISQLQSTSKATVTDSLPRPSTIILLSLGTLLAMSSRKLILNVSKI